MTLPTLLDALNQAGVRLAVASGKLRMDAPVGVLTPELREALIIHKPMILEALAPAPDPYAVAEREAIQWESSLASTDGIVTLAKVIAEWEELEAEAENRDRPVEVELLPDERRVFVLQHDAIADSCTWDWTPTASKPKGDDSPGEPPSTFELGRWEMNFSDVQRRVFNLWTDSHLHLHPQKSKAEARQVAYHVLARRWGNWKGERKIVAQDAPGGPILDADESNIDRKT